MKISGCSSCEAVRPVRYQPGQRAPGGQRGDVREAVELSRARKTSTQSAPTAHRTQAPAQAQAVAFQRSASQSAEITVTTAEGDKVTLSLAAVSQQTQQAYIGQGYDESGAPQTIRGGSSTDQSAASVKIGIQGNLSDKEVADIQKLIKAFGQLAQGDSSGVGQFGKLDSLSSAQFAYSATQQSGYGAVQLYA